MNSPSKYDRNLKGYGPKSGVVNWPKNAKIAIQFVLNYEEGGENCILHGDEHAETFLTEIANAPMIKGARHMSVESLFEYGSRAGVWRLLDTFKHYDLPLTIFAVGSALERYPEMGETFARLDHEVCGHGYKWINYQDISPDLELEHIHRTVEVITSQTGQKPVGWYTGRTSPNTARLVTETGLFKYHSDDYSDDIPFWSNNHSKEILIIPYTLDVNDMNFFSPYGFSTSSQFLNYLKDSFDTLYEEGAHAPKMMNVGLHCRISGRPGRIAALKSFLEYICSKPDVWICKRAEISDHWHDVYGGQFQNTDLNI